MKEPKNNDMFQHAFYLTKAQNDELMAIAKRLECQSVSELFAKFIEFSKILDKTFTGGLELVMLDPKETKVITNKEDGRVMMLMKSKKSFEYVNEHIKDMLQIKQQIANTTGWGMPTDPIKC